MNATTETKPTELASDSASSRAAQCYAAVWTVHTPSGPTDACEAHADKLQRLIQFMGAYTNKTPAPEGAQCANCINEAKRHNNPSSATAGPKTL